MARIAGTNKQETEAKILNSALHCLANLGDKATTFQSIAAHAGVSSALVVLYFKSREKIYPRVLDYVISAARQETSKAVQTPQNPVEQLRAYYRISIDFFRSTPERAKIYLLLYHFASFDPEYARRSTEIKEVAIQRIETILSAGEAEGLFHFTESKSLTARFIHNSLNGMLISLLTNVQPQSDHVLLQQFEKFMLKIISSKK